VSDDQQPESRSTSEFPSKAFHHGSDPDVASLIIADKSAWRDGAEYPPADKTLVKPNLDYGSSVGDRFR
jgi:hypothetical protein